jgi:hypothetical protein
VSANRVDGYPFHPLAGQLVPIVDHFEHEEASISLEARHCHQTDIVSGIIVD